MTKDVAVSRWRVPRGAAYFGIRITAGENVVDDATNEFHGHYVDDISVQIHPRARAAQSLSVLRYSGFYRFFSDE